MGTGTIRALRSWQEPRTARFTCTGGGVECFLFNYDYRPVWLTMLLTGYNCLKLAALFKLNQLKTHQEIKALNKRWCEITRHLWSPLIANGPGMAYCSGSAGGNPRLIFFKGKKSRECTYQLAACRPKASVPRIKDYHTNCCPCTPNRLTRPQIHQTERNHLQLRLQNTSIKKWELEEVAKTWAAWRNMAVCCLRRRCSMQNYSVPI